MTDKRFDIQGLRSWAVIAVVVFHFFPKLLPFGYLGVDVFFVLSGFLISLVLNNKPIAISTYTNFYFKRIRRIFPLLTLLVLICSIYTVLCYDELLVIYSEKPALYAALFITNLKGGNEGEDYFRDLANADDLYTHTWSLSVEIQFYLIAPLLLHLLKTSFTKYIYTMGYLLALAGLSIVYAMSLTPSTAFYSTLARLWQFTAGAIAFRLQKKDPLPVTEKSTKLIAFNSIACKLNFVVPAVIAVALVVWRAALGDLESSLRCGVTFMAAVLLVLKLTTPILTHRWLQTIGDSSYGLYLIHWPVVCIVRYYTSNQWTSLRFHTQAGQGGISEPTLHVINLSALLLCVAVAIVVYEYYEKWYLRLNEKWTFLLIGGLYFASASTFFLYCMTHSDDGLPADIDRARTYEEALPINQYMDSHWEMNLRLKGCTPRNSWIDKNPWGFCNMPAGNGSLSFLVIGNSVAANHGRLIADNLRDHYNRLAIHTVSECEPLIETKNEYCQDALKLQQGFLNDIDAFKPDILFILSRYIDPNVPLDSETIEDDTIYKSMMNALKRYEANVRKVFILQALHRTSNLQNVENSRLKAGKSVEGFIDEAIEADSTPMRRRVEELAKHCEKCVIYDVMSMHLLNGTFMVTNPTTHLHYFEALQHHTPIGLKLVEPIYRTLSDNFPDLVESKSPHNFLA